MAHALRPVGLPRRIARCLAFFGAIALALFATRRTVCGHARRLLRALGVRLVAAVPIPPGTLLAANHISWLDPVAILATAPVTFLAKQEVAGWPLVGRMTRRVGTRYLHREGLLSLPDIIGDLAGELRRGETVAVFPGGTTWCTPPGGRFRGAVFQAALDAGAPVRPVTIRYEQAGRPSTVAAFVGDTSLVASLRQVLRARDLTVHITVHGPLAHDPTQPAGTARRRLADAAHHTISAANPDPGQSRDRRVPDGEPARQVGFDR